MFVFTYVWFVLSGVPVPVSLSNQPLKVVVSELISIVKVAESP
jgi:hypothetical protein